MATLVLSYLATFGMKTWWLIHKKMVLVKEFISCFLNHLPWPKKYDGWCFGTFGLYFSIWGISASQLTHILRSGEKPPTRICNGIITTIIISSHYWWLSHKQIPLYNPIIIQRGCEKPPSRKYRWKDLWDSPKMDFAVGADDELRSVGVVCSRGCYMLDAFWRWQIPKSWVMFN